MAREGECPPLNWLVCSATSDDGPGVPRRYLSVPLCPAIYHRRPHASVPPIHLCLPRQNRLRFYGFLGRWLPRHPRSWSQGSRGAILGAPGPSVPAPGYSRLSGGDDQITQCSAPLPCPPSSLFCFLFGLPIIPGMTPNCTHSSGPDDMPHSLGGIDFSLLTSHGGTVGGSKEVGLVKRHL